MQDTGFKREAVLNKLQGMKVIYAQDRVWENPVSLLAHFQEFEAYTTILESHYAKMRQSEEEKSTQIIAEEWEAKKKHDELATRPSDKMTQGEVDKNVEYRMRVIKSELKLLETETKSCRAHVNAMQSILKAYGDESKSIR